jgi:hypothetical protein
MMRHKRMLLAALATLAGIGGEARAQSKGIAVSELLSAEPMTVGALVSASAKVVAPKASVSVASAPKSRDAQLAVTAGEAVSLGAMTVSDWTRVTRPTPAAPVATLTADGETMFQKPEVVRVVIPATADAEPVAVAMDERTARTTAAEAAPTAVTDAAGQLTLAITATEAGLEFQPNRLTFGRAGMTASVAVSGPKAAGVSMFVRDQSFVSYDASRQELKALRKGVTELYAVVNGQMAILPVTVAEAAGGAWDLQVPEALVSLEGVLRGPTSSAIYRGEAGGTAAEGNAEGPSLAQSVADTVASVQEAAAEERRFATGTDNVDYKSLSLQVVDERSSPAAGKLYPVGGARVSVVGTEFSAQTDATGHLTVRDVPSRSRFLLSVDDARGSVRPVVAEVTSGATGDDGVRRVRVMRAFSFDAYAEHAGVAQHAAYGSLCAHFTDAQADGAPANGITVELDVESDGPYYFNQYGFLDATLHATGPDGRACFFNVPPGPVALHVYEGEAWMATLPVATYPGRHAEEDFVLGGERKLTSRLAAMASAHEQLSNDLRLANSYRTVDMVDLIPLGMRDPMMQTGPGLVETSDAVLPVNGRVWALAQAAEFESVVYSYVAGATGNVTPLIPRGFIEDLSVYAQVSYDPALGSVVVEYGGGERAGTDALVLRLLDHDGQDVGDGWYYGDRPLTKAIFFNVPAGHYAVLAETRDGYWLGADTAMVYNETVSYVRLGGGIRYRP